ncbi:GNAT family N-acetyltransferase [Agrococcus sp. SL85]|uniref:GNAT family N-acetyltransferase n=1 Tax=Agrococcus sp. SL85 TaxID=2995141 RepID=UPI00226CFFD5|nr:GNAT family N-acetyltransferase [Agrococcus sp. SL85]WAC66405.1 GNAT family N-acetyltransferase [Agrococcus sp. SL85]
MTGLVVERADFAEPALLAFLQAHLDDMAPTAPPESQHALDARELQAPGVRLWVARSGGRIVGTVALAALEPAHEELKSMRTDPALRGAGVGSRMLRHALDDAASRGIARISLETGAQDFFAPARALYATHGFAPCPPFGDYWDDPLSAFMTRELAPGA